jgi:hypothetical protein
MAQLVGLDCQLCGKRIGSELNARFCTSCRAAIHNDCVASEVSITQGHCKTCGVDLKKARISGNREKENRHPPEPKKGPYPVSTNCPICGSTEYKVRRPERLIAFRWDRLCRSCDTRYTPPTPVWAAVMFIFIGLLFIGIFGLEILIPLAAGRMISPPGMVCSGFLAILGILSIVHGYRSLSDPGKA